MPQETHSHISAYQAVPILLGELIVATAHQLGEL